MHVHVEQRHTLPQRKYRYSHKHRFRTATHISVPTCAQRRTTAISLAAVYRIFPRRPITNYAMRQSQPWNPGARARGRTGHCRGESTRAAAAAQLRSGIRAGACRRGVHSRCGGYAHHPRLLRTADRARCRASPGSAAYSSSTFTPGLPQRALRSSPRLAMRRSRTGSARGGRCGTYASLNHHSHTQLLSECWRTHVVARTHDCTCNKCFRVLGTGFSDRFKRARAQPGGALLAVLAQFTVCAPSILRGTQRRVAVRALLAHELNAELPALLPLQNHWHTA
jgi:hypothetical protein